MAAQNGQPEVGCAMVGTNGWSSGQQGSSLATTKFKFVEMKRRGHPETLFSSSLTHAALDTMAVSASFSGPIALIFRNLWHAKGEQSAARPALRTLRKFEPRAFCADFSAPGPGEPPAARGASELRRLFGGDAAHVRNLRQPRGCRGSSL